jgi:pyruvate dehydrogenase E1 component alpha subunit
MSVDQLWTLYPPMLRSRLLEEAVGRLWDEGRISGEMHLGTGEEGIVSGVVAHLRDGDAMALDHRGTAPLVMRGVAPVLLLREFLGHSGGLCAGNGGHMHLFAPRELAVSSGIVGASGPAAAGFGLAAQHHNRGGVAVAFFGEGAMNQGMMLESINLAAVWKLPVVFVCKDDDWSIAARSHQMTGGSLFDRANGLGVHTVEADGREVVEIYENAGPAIERARAGYGPTFIRATCVHLEGHFLGFELIRAVKSPLKRMPRMTGQLTRAMLRARGASIGERLAGFKEVRGVMRDARRDPRRSMDNDPVARAREALFAEDIERVRALEADIVTEVDRALAVSLEGLS